MNKKTPVIIVRKNTRIRNNKEKNYTDTVKKEIKVVRQKNFKV